MAWMNEMSYNAFKLGPALLKPSFAFRVKKNPFFSKKCGIKEHVFSSIM